MSLLWTSIVIRATITLRKIDGIYPLTINVNYFSCFIIICKFFSISSPVFSFSIMLSYVFIVQIIWLATATTWLDWAIIQSVFVLYLPSSHSWYPTPIIFLTVSYISFCKWPSQISTLFFAVTMFLKKTLYFYGLIMPSIAFVYVVGFPPTM